MVRPRPALPTTSSYFETFYCLANVTYLYPTGHEDLILSQLKHILDAEKETDLIRLKDPYLSFIHSNLDLLNAD